jgi:serine/threonine protein kinase
MEIAQGITVQKWIHKNGAMSEEHVKVFLEKLSIAVQGVHGANLIHRDIKSPNVFIDGDLDDPIVTLIDFGISAQFENSSTHAQVTNRCYSPFYAPPEQKTHNEARPCTDVFAIGAIGYELLTGLDCSGRQDMTGRYKPALHGPKNKDGTPIISEDFSGVITKATWDNAGWRYKMMDELILAIRGRPMPKNMPRIIADTKEWIMEEDEIWICRKHDGLSKMKRIFVTERTDPKSRDRYISRFHAVIKKGRDGRYKIYDQGYDRPTGGDKSANGTVWKREKSSEWRELPANGLPLHQHYMEIGLGYTDQAPNAVDAGGEPILPGAYKTIVYAPPDNLNTET